MDDQNRVLRDRRSGLPQELSILLLLLLLRTKILITNIVTIIIVVIVIAITSQAAAVALFLEEVLPCSIFTVLLAPAQSFT